MTNAADTLHWSSLAAPDAEAFAALAERAFEGLPESFRARCGDIVVRVEEFPDDEIAEDMGLESPFDLLGLYQGVDRIARGVEPAAPSFVFLYRRPILDVWAEGEETLGHLVTHVLIHEIGHHFGLSDADMHAIEEAAG
ncbi:MAG: metallopeptidase family protein [Pseudomonadota bacterium]